MNYGRIGQIMQEKVWQHPPSTKPEGALAGAMAGHLKMEAYFSVFFQRDTNSHDSKK